MKIEMPKSPFLEGRWNFEWFASGSPGLIAIQVLFQRFPPALANLSKLDASIKDGYANISAKDATHALKSLNGKRIGGVQIRLDYLRSQSSKREHGEGHFPGRNFGSSDFPWMGHDSSGNYPEPNLSGSKRNPYDGKEINKELERETDSLALEMLND
ncbi:hypothetical protein ACS0TY_004566 [Phlomoides rotata]